MKITVEASFTFPTVSAGMIRGLLRKEKVRNYESMGNGEWILKFANMYICRHVWKLNPPGRTRGKSRWGGSSGDHEALHQPSQEV